jgi:uncharacterized protein (TIGR04255 family)
MSDPSGLPVFAKPPVNEVAIGVQFNALPLSFVHLGRFFEVARSAYPTHQTAAPLPPNVERFDAIGPLAHQEFGFQFSVGNSFPFMSGGDIGIPRVWFLSKDETRVLQLQPDRLLVNWRARPHAPDYPRYGTVEGMFRDAYIKLRNFAVAEGLGELFVNQCEVSYFNRIDPPAEGGLSHPDRVFRLWSDLWSADGGLPGQPEVAAFTARRRLVTGDGEPLGRLHIRAGSALTPETERVFMLELTVRGNPTGPGLDGAQSFHNLSHEAIVRTFAAITTEEMHVKWGKTQ